LFCISALFIVTLSSIFLFFSTGPYPVASLRLKYAINGLMRNTRILATSPTS